MSFYEKIYSLIWASAVLFWDFALIQISESDRTPFLIKLTNNFAFPKNPKILQVNLGQWQIAHDEKESNLSRNTKERNLHTLSSQIYIPY